MIRVVTRCCLLGVLFYQAFLAPGAPATMPDLPSGALTQWVVEEPEEIVSYLAFDPAGVLPRLPAGLRFITIEELAAGGVAWAKAFLVQYPRKSQWGVSFLEFVRMRTFAIDGRAPEWPPKGAAVLWLARVAPSEPTADLGPGRPYLILDFWIPDRAYADYMRGKGYYATYGDATFQRSAAGRWSGSLAVEGLDITADCMPTGPVTGGVGSAGMQAFFPPGSSAIADVVRVAFAGHREQACETARSWTFRGRHPLASSIVLGAPTFQFGYHLRGGTYPHRRP